MVKNPALPLAFVLLSTLRELPRIDSESTHASFQTSILHKLMGRETPVQMRASMLFLHDGERQL